LTNPRQSANNLRIIIDPDQIADGLARHDQHAIHFGAVTG